MSLRLTVVKRFFTGNWLTGEGEESLRRRMTGLSGRPHLEDSEAESSSESETPTLEPTAPGPSGNNHLCFLYAIECRNV